jgi:CDP-6-deoxy-D-xylo-4-hexulose-3-dehydrase
VRPLEFSGAVGLEQLKKLDAMLAVRRSNAAHFVDRFQHDSRFIIQREHGTSSWFSFTMILRPDAGIERAGVMTALRKAGIEFRMITGGCFPMHRAIEFFDYDIVGVIANATLAHEQGFFVGNHPHDIRREIDELHQVLATYK